jgi:hypothetical protein
MQDKIESLFKEATQEEITNGVQWYPISNSFCKTLGTKYDKKLETVAALTAGFSVQKSWPINQRLVIDFLEGKQVGHLSHVVNKALEIIMAKGEEDDSYYTRILNGPKTQSFYDNIVHPDTSEKVTIDSHMTDAFMPKEWKSLTPKRYKAIEKEIVLFAKKQGYKVPQMQAILWLTKKKTWNSRIKSIHFSTHTTED